MKEKELKEGLPEDSSQGIDRRGFLSAAGAFGATALIHSSAENLFAAEKKIGLLNKHQTINSTPANRGGGNARGSCSPWKGTTAAPTPASNDHF